MSPDLDHVVAMAGSAGALPVMLAQVRRMMAKDSSCLFVIYHRSGTTPFPLRRFVRAANGYRVLEAQDGLEVRANHIYHPWRSHDLEVRGGRLLVQSPFGRPHPSIDRLLASLAREFGSRVLAVLLSGYGSDGVAGLREVEAARGRTIVQAPWDAEHPVLPARAIAAGRGHWVLPSDAIVDAVEDVLTGRPEPWLSHLR